MAFLAILEKMSYPNCATDLLDPAFHELEVGVVAQAEFVQPLGLGPTDITGGGIALRVNVCVVPDERIPVLITRPFDRLSNVFPSECHGRSLLITLRQVRSPQGYSPRSVQMP
jgi:hypothetical protein